MYDYDVGFDEDGRILAACRSQLASRCGFSVGPVGPAMNDRAMFHADNCYWHRPTSRSRPYRCKTNTVSDTAFRGFGGPQGMFAIEYIMDDGCRAR